jgi:eukaryotic-like serine/threonine-protein kinase
MPWRRRQVTREAAVPPRGRPLLWPWLLLLLLFVGGIIAAAVLLARDDDKPKVPNVVGLSTGSAVAELGRRGYAADVEQTIRPSAKPGTVLSQAPSAGTKLDEGGRVTIVAARGTVTVGVPDVVGLSAARALVRLQAVGLRGRMRPVTSKQPANTVLSQAPAAEGRAPKGSTVVLTISGSGTVTVPRVVGLTEAQATAKLSAVGFRTRVSRIASAKEEGLVISQVPAQGANARRGSVVGLDVSDGPATTTNSTTGSTTTGASPPPPPPGAKGVPNVVGKGQLQAIRRLEAAGFRVDSYPAKSGRPRGLVVSQKPPAGARAQPQSIVRINVSLGPGARPLRVVPDVAGKSESAAKHLLAQVGFTVRAVAPAADSSAAGAVVVDQKPKAGNRARAGSQVLIYLGAQ